MRKYWWIAPVLAVALLAILFWPANDVAPSAGGIDIVGPNCHTDVDGPFARAKCIIARDNCIEDCKFWCAVAGGYCTAVYFGGEEDDFQCYISLNECSE